MRLNNDCVRDLLLYLEEHLEDDPINIAKIKLKNYTEKDVIYTGLKLIEAGFINGKPTYADNKVYYFAVSSITYNGHQFLDTIKPLTVWEKTKEAANKVGATSLTVLSQIAIQIGTSIITQQMTG